MGREILGDDHTGIDFVCLNDNTGIVIFRIAIPVLTSDVTMTVLVLLFFLITIPVLTSFVAMTVPVPVKNYMREQNNQL
jgi:hypothetical protein